MNVNASEVLLMFKFKVGEIVVHEHVEDLPVAAIKALEFRSIRSILVFEAGEIVPRPRPSWGPSGSYNKKFVVF